MNADDQPVRLYGWAALAVSVVLSAAACWAVGLDVRETVAVLVPFVAGSIAGVEAAARTAFAPSTVDRRIARVRAAERSAPRLDLLEPPDPPPVVERDRDALVAAALAVDTAVTDPARMPAYHQAQTARLARDWPSLAHAITQVVTAVAVKDSRE